MLQDTATSHVKNVAASNFTTLIDDLFSEENGTNIELTFRVHLIHFW